MCARCKLIHVLLHFTQKAAMQHRQAYFNTPYTHTNVVKSHCMLQ